MMAEALRTVEQINAYLKEKNIFPESAGLITEDLRAVKESAEGFVNQIYRIRGSNGFSVVMKQVLDTPLSRTDSLESGEPDAHLHDWTLDPGRMRNEISVLIFWNGIYPGICPEIYLFDEENGVIVMEDLTALSLLRFDFARMKEYPALGSTLGCFLARNLFYSSSLHLTRYRYDKLVKFFDNPEYRALAPFLFEECTIVSPHRTMPKATMPTRMTVINDAAVQKEIVRLKDTFLTQPECLIHTDLHASNIMVDAERIKIIDTEFAGFGPIAQDFGRLTASFCLDFFSWYGDDGEHSAAEKAGYQSYLLTTVNAIYSHFDAEFRALCEQNKKDDYNLKRLDLEKYLQVHFKDALSYTALNTASRIGDRGICHDLERLPVAERVYPQLLILTFCREVLSGAKTFSCIEEFTAYLADLANDHPRESFF